LSAGAAAGGGWVVVVPVKGSTGKSRLEHPDRARLAAAIALDTLDAVRRARLVAEVVVVTADDRLAEEVAGPDAAGPDAAGPAPVRVVRDPGAGLNGAVAAGLAAVAPHRGRAALLGDLPALDPADLDAALELAAERPRALVPDAEGAGTTLITARPGEPLHPSFGEDSRALHEAAGFTPLDVPAASTLRRDVDTARQLQAAAVLGLGPRTSALL
jgi:2-phospho-L-lactate guanylyltransferase